LCELPEIRVSGPSKTKGIMFTHLCAYCLMCGFSFSSFLLRILYCVSYNNMVSTLIYINTCEWVYIYKKFISLWRYILEAISQRNNIFVFLWLKFKITFSFNNQISVDMIAANLYVSAACGAISEHDK